MEIPEGFAQVTFLYGGTMQPTGAATTVGADVTEYTGTPFDLAVEMKARWVTYFKGNVGSGLTLTGVMVKYGPTDTGPGWLEAANEVGSIGSQGAAPQAAFLLRKFTATGGRQGRGRMYQPGVYESATGGDGIVTAGIIDDWNSDLNAFVSSCALEDFPLVLLHSAGTPVSTPSPIIVIQCESKLATQRRRMRR